MRLHCIILATALAATGCATDQLRFAAKRHTSSVPDIYKQQVLENLARVAEDPAAMPFFSVVDNGVPGVTDKGTLGGFFMFPAQTLVKQLHNQRGGQLGPLTGERDVSVNWTMKPISDEGRLRAMQCMYLWVAGRLRPEEIDECQQKIGKYYKDDKGDTKFNLPEVPWGWLCSGSWLEKPKDDTNCVHHHGRYYWAAPGREAALTDLTLRMLKIATTIPRTKTVVRNYFDESGRVVQFETSTEALEKIIPAGKVFRTPADTEAQRVVKQGVQALANEFKRGSNFPTALQGIIEAGTEHQLNVMDSVSSNPQENAAVKSLKGQVQALRQNWQNASVDRAAQDKLSGRELLDSSPDPGLTIDAVPNDVTPALLSLPRN